MPLSNQRGRMKDTESALNWQALPYATAEAAAAFDQETSTDGSAPAKNSRKWNALKGERLRPLRGLWSQLVEPSKANSIAYKFYAIATKNLAAGHGSRRLVDGGRFAAQNLPRRHRGAIYSNCVELDIANCDPTLLLHLVDSVAWGKNPPPLVSLRALVHSRADFYKSVNVADAAVAKRETLMVMYGHEPAPGSTLEALAKDMNLVREILAQAKPELLDGIAQLKQEDDDHRPHGLTYKSDPKRSIVHYVTGDLCNAVISSVRGHLENSLGSVVVSEIFDGFLVPRGFRKEVEDLIPNLEAYVARDFGGLKITHGHTSSL